MRKGPSLLRLLFLGFRGRRIDRAVGAHAHRLGGDDQFALLVAVFGDALGEHQLAAAATFLLVGVAGLGGGGEHVAGLQVPVIFEVLLGMEAAATAAASPTAA